MRNYTREYHAATTAQEGLDVVAGAALEALNLARNLRDCPDGVPAMTLTAQSGGPERYVRINITKNSKGYQHETTVSLRWTGDDFEGEGASTALAELLADADEQARDEIGRRVRMDALEGGSTA